ncbi:uncharacterized protein K452DRAFT_215267, partial [Aplosporella prunicola CBS 121167]
GCRFGMFVGAILAWLVFITNISVLAWASRAKNGSIYTGDCNKVERTSTVIHLLINILSSLLLGASNYCMQCLCAPTRAEVDQAHFQRRFIEIGVQSIRNFRLIKRWKFIIWCLLGVSSLPLHLVYNSVFYSSLANHDYWVLGIDQKLPDPTSGDIFNELGCLSADEDTIDPIALRKNMTADSSNLERLSNSQCLDAYSKDLLPERSNLILVMQSNDTICQQKDSEQFCSWSYCAYNCSQSFLYILHTYGVESPTYDWMIAAEAYEAYDRDEVNAKLAKIKEHPDNWAVQGVPIKGCLSQRVEPKCRLNFSLPLGITAVVFNFMKAFCITIVLWFYRDQPLVTVGDAVASFLLSPDPDTAGLCLTTAIEVQDIWGRQENTTVKAKEAYNQHKLSYSKGASRNVWIAWIILTNCYSFITCISVTTTLAIYGSTKTTREGWRSGLGAVTVSNIINGWAIPSSNVVASILIANIPQTVLSFLYLIHNNLWTRMLLAAEWSDFAYERKGLRLSSRNADSSQRSTYFLQVPYRYGIPLMALCTLLHWMISQSIYLAVIDMYSMSDELIPEERIVTCGYSLVAIICTIVVALIMMVVTIIMARMKKLKPGIPLVGSNSVAIAAACHAPTDGADPRKPVKWGEV